MSRPGRAARWRPWSWERFHPVTASLFFPTLQRLAFTTLRAKSEMIQRSHKFALHGVSVAVATAFSELDISEIRVSSHRGKVICKRWKPTLPPTYFQR